MPISRSAFLVKSLQQNAAKFSLNNVSRIKIEYSKIGANQASTRKFIQQELPLFKYQNPSLSVQTNAYSEDNYDPKITIMYSNDTNEVLKTATLNSKEISAKILKQDAN